MCAFISSLRTTIIIISGDNFNRNRRQTHAKCIRHSERNEKARAAHTHTHLPWLSWPCSYCVELKAFTSVSNGDDFALMCIFACDFFVVAFRLVRHCEWWCTASDSNSVATYSVVLSMQCSRHALFQCVLSISETGFSSEPGCKMQYSVGSYFAMSPRLIVEQSCGDWPMQMCVNCAEKV